MTYSIGTTGSPAENPNQPLSLVLSDTSATTGGQAAAMQNNTQILCKNPDGSQSYYTIDAERSIPGVRRVLNRV